MTWENIYEKIISLNIFYNGLVHFEFGVFVLTLDYSIGYFMASVCHY